MKEYLYFSVFIGILFVYSLSIKYFEYKDFSKFSTVTSTLFVENQYKKKDYFVFKLRTENNFLFYSISKENIKNLSGFYIEADIQIKVDFSFVDYLSGDFLFIRNLKIVSEKRAVRYTFLENLKNIHSDKIAELYSALFFATPIGKDLRGDLSRLGINHLAVLSGFHVSFIIGVIFLFSRILYRPIHQKFFPYRNFIKDIAFVSIFLIISYLIFLDTPSSFLRAVSMFIIGFFLFDRNLLKARFEVLNISVIILLAFQPTLLFSVGFWFSVSGVFYILLYLKYFKFSKILDIVFINLWVFIAMIPIVHYIFPDFHILQLLSPIWTILFSAFYPFSALIHIFGFGNILDPYLNSFLSLNFDSNYQFITSNWFLIIYIIISIGFALKKRDLKN